MQEAIKLLCNIHAFAYISRAKVKKDLTGIGSEHQEDGR